MDRETEFDFFDIDLNRLDEEWIGQPKTFFKYAAELADARKELEEAKAELDVLKATIDKNIRDDSDAFGLPGKTTETLISNTILLQPLYQNAMKDYREKKHRVDMVQAAVSALDHRKSALERLVSLHGQNYFATPKPIDSESEEAVHDIEKGAARRKGRKRNKRE